LPYVVVSKLKVDDPNATTPGYAGLRQAAGFGVSAANTVIGGTNAVLNTQKLEQKTLSLGGRWDATRSLAVKAQFDRITKPAGSDGLFLVPDLSADLNKGNSSFLNKKNINVISVAVDFVF
jgi:hypothetical protein